MIFFWISLAFFLIYLLLSIIVSMFNWGFWGILLLCLIGLLLFVLFRQSSKKVQVLFCRWGNTASIGGIDVGTPEWFRWLEENRVDELIYEVDSEFALCLCHFKKKGSIWYAYSCKDFRLNHRIRVEVGNNSAFTLDAVHSAAHKIELMERFGTTREVPIVLRQGNTARCGEIAVGTPEWFRWLDENRVDKFAFEKDGGSAPELCDFKKEGPIWYAHSFSGGLRVEVGNNSALTLDGIFSAHYSLVQMQRSRYVDR